MLKIFWPFNVIKRSSNSSYFFVCSLPISLLKICALLVWCPWLILLVPLYLMLLANAAVQESKLSWLLVITLSQPRLSQKELESFQKVHVPQAGFANFIDEWSQCDFCFTNFGVIFEYLESSITTKKTFLQPNLTNTDTEWTKQSVCIREVSIF